MDLDLKRAPRGGARESSVCPLMLALGLPGNCAGPPCIYYRVPHVRDECAVREWAPDLREQPELARWFLARCDFSTEISRATGVTASTG
jgi:hypothetical protein